MTTCSMQELCSKRQKKRFQNYVIVSALVLLEYLNSLLRYFAIVDMAKGVFIRKIIFVLLLCYVAVEIIKEMRITVLGSAICKRYVVFLFMYVYFAGVYLLTENKFDIADISNMVMPLIVGILGYKSFWNKNDRFLDRYSTVYVLSLTGMYLVNVRYGKFQYTPVGLNSIYYIVLFFPMVFLMYGKKMRRLLATVIVLLTLASYKTTAILCVLCCSFIYYLIQNNKIVQKFVLLPIVASVGILVSYLIAYKVLSIDILKTYIEQNILDGGNGRIEIWKKLLEIYFHGNVAQILFGSGFDGALRVLGRSAHNDFLEVLFDFGVVGLSLLLSSFVVCIRIGIRMYKRNYVYTVVFFMLIAEVFIMFFFSNFLFMASYILIVIINMFMLISDFDYSIQPSK